MWCVQASENTLTAKESDERVFLWFSSVVT